MSQELNAQDLAEELHSLSGLAVVIAGIEEDGDRAIVHLGEKGAGFDDLEAIATLLLAMCKGPLEMLAPTNTDCQPQLDRVTAALQALRPLASAEPKREVH